ncbi:MAG TPA: methyltransferase domain-containing protein [Gaiella sp.]
MRAERAASFARVADAYERARPGYPADAVLWLAGETPCDVVDLGAGTGKLTRSLAALGHHVVAVEPLAEMLDRLRAAVPGVTAVVGTAESMPLPDGSADVVTCAQAFHWFDHEPALAEIARVLRPGGRIALVWNVRDERAAWVAELSDAMVGRTGVDRGATEPIERSGLYGEVQRATFEHTQDVDREALRELVLSRSYCAVLRDEERAPILGRVDRLFDERARNGLLTLPYLVECFRADRL